MLHTKEKWYAHLKDCAAGGLPGGVTFVDSGDGDLGTRTILFGTQGA